MEDKEPFNTEAKEKIKIYEKQTGKTNFLNVIDSWRGWLDFELMLHRETIDLETPFSELQREVGLQLVRASHVANDATNEE